MGFRKLQHKSILPIDFIEIKCFTNIEFIQNFAVDYKKKSIK